MYKMSEIRALDTKQLKELYITSLNKLYNLNVRQSDENFKPHEYKLLKKAVARVLTCLREQGENNGK